MSFIYTLSDPRTNEIRYVGKTEDLRLRLRCHLKAKEHTHRTMWIRSLTAIGLVPIMEVLEEVETNEWQEAERFWIATLRFYGFRLTNLDNGGRGSGSVSDETKRKMSLSKRGRKQSPDHIAKRVAIRTGRPMHPNAAAALKKSHIGFVHSHESRLKMSVSRKGMKQHPNTVAALNGFWIGRKHSALTRAKMSLRKRKADAIKKCDLFSYSEIEGLKASDFVTETTGAKGTK